MAEIPPLNWRLSRETQGGIGSCNAKIRDGCNFKPLTERGNLVIIFLFFIHIFWILYLQNIMGQTGVDIQLPVRFIYFWPFPNSFIGLREPWWSNIPLEKALLKSFPVHIIFNSFQSGINFLNQHFSVWKEFPVYHSSPLLLYKHSPWKRKMIFGNSFWVLKSALFTINKRSKIIVGINSITSILIMNPAINTKST